MGHGSTRTRSALVWCTAILLVGVSAQGVHASDGRLEISQARVDASGGFPFRIEQSGSWVLTSDLIVPNANTTAIEVAREQVTLDLNGFSILGPLAAGSGDGVVLVPNNGTLGPVIVRNGIIRGVGDDAVDAVGDQVRVEDLVAMDNGDAGIFLGGGEAARNIVRDNGGVGIRCGATCVIRENYVTGNGGDGLNGSGLAEGNTCSNNGGDGIDWSPSGLVIGNALINNTGWGLRLSSASGYQNNVATGNFSTQITGGIDMGSNVP
jgi:hypothetical protein